MAADPALRGLFDEEAPIRGNRPVTVKHVPDSLLRDLSALGRGKHPRQPRLAAAKSNSAIQGDLSGGKRHKERIQYLL